MTLNATEIIFIYIWQSFISNVCNIFSKNNIIIKTTNFLFYLWNTNFLFSFSVDIKYDFILKYEQLNNILIRHIFNTYSLLSFLICGSIRIYLWFRKIFSSALNFHQ